MSPVSIMAYNNLQNGDRTKNVVEKTRDGQLL